ncbi:MAG: Crp/Fnr family transcriptional regulator [Kofleriaceae bacterium]
MTDLLRVLRTFALGREASPEALTRLAAAAAWHTAAEGDVLWEEGARSERVLLITAGLVQIVRHDRGGDDTSLALFGPRELIGLTAVLADGRYPAAAMVVSERATVLALPAAQVTSEAAADLGFARSVNHALIEHTRALHAKISMVTGGTVAQRLAVTFTHLAERFGDEDTDGATVIPLTLTRRMLAQLIGARTETVVRTLTAWQRDGLLATTGDGFRFRSPAALAALAEAAG